MAIMAGVNRTRRGAVAADPTAVRLSKHFLLSDFMGCHSVYGQGFPNIFLSSDANKLEEGRYLCDKVLEPTLEESPLSISYGFISRDLAGRIVKYQSPDKPSYHQWNDGAACDFITHDADARDVAPIYLAEGMDENMPLSRLITYSESPFICVATRIREEGAPRRAFYENRFNGKHQVKPQFITVPKDREAFFRNHQLKHDWRGAGYPTYHGGGVRQAQHIRVGKYNMLSDFLYSTEATQKGYKNYPTITNNCLARFRRVAGVYTELIDSMDVPRLSITRAYESKVWSTDELHNWSGDRFAINLSLPESTEMQVFVDAAMSIPSIEGYSGEPRTGKVSVVGIF